MKKYYLNIFSKIKVKYFYLKCFLDSLIILIPAFNLLSVINQYYPQQQFYQELTFILHKSVKLPKLMQRYIRNNLH